MQSPPERGARECEEAWTPARQRGCDGRLTEPANVRRAEHTSHPAPCIPALAPARFSIPFFFAGSGSGPPAPGTGRGQKGEQRAVGHLARRAHLETPGSVSVPLVLSRVLRVPTAGWRPSSPHLHLPSPPKVLEIETDAGKKKKKKSRK